MFIFIRNSKFSKAVAMLLIINVIGQIALPGVAFALTGGPSQPEVESFEPVGTSEMVDLFSGDFNYNIPLLDVDGYPINISYHSGISNDQEASWVGLGWNINPGVINRNMRGLPDDFKGDIVHKEFNMKPNNTYGVTGTLGGEIFGIKKKSGFDLSIGLGISYNNYNGVGIDRILNPSICAGDKAKGPNTSWLGVSLNSSSESGLTVRPSFSFPLIVNDKEKSNNNVIGGVGVTFNTRAGLSSLSLSANTTANRYAKSPNGGKPVLTGETKGNLGSSISFGMPTFVPQSQMPMVNGSVSLSAKVGFTATASDITVNITGYQSTQRLAVNQTNIPAYGYLNSDHGASKDVALMDFNREKEIPFNQNTPALPVTNYTYDVYSVSGQGVGGNYRPFRSEIGTVFDSYTNSTSESSSLGAEIAGGAVAKGGIDISINDVTTYTGKWTSDNPAAGKLAFKGSKDNDLLYEPYYFKQAGEKFVDSDKDFFEKTGGFDAVRVGLGNLRDDLKIPTNNKFIKSSGTEIDMPADNTRSKRQKRNEAITILSRAEAKRFGLSGTGKQYTNTPDHHIAEITSLRADGARYVYGIAAYNLTQEETSFSVGESKDRQARAADCMTGLVTYDTEDNSLGNKMGLDNYYSKTVLPAYAHSYLLTAVLSPDYVDYDNVRGPSRGDLGTYTQFIYNKPTDPYKWRVPFESYKANYNEGMKTNPSDDQGNYIYGEKELWYLDTIVTKNYTAIFIKSDRKDGYGVAGKNGGLSTTVAMQKLDRIELYANSNMSVPVKVVHFEYDYSLCKNIPNYNGAGTPGKLTLRKIYFTYGNSKKGRLSPYVFTYDSYNPDYNLKAYDRWGNYNPVTHLDSCFALMPVPLTGEFPYVTQNKTLADQYASAWSLTDIRLPSGGKIKVTYESDDYAYVQDKTAMQMMTMTGLGTSKNTVSTSGALNENTRYIFFKLPQNLPSDANVAYWEKAYLEGITSLYFRAYVRMTNSPLSSEYVSGYAEIDPNERFGLTADGSDGSKKTHAWVKIKSVPIGDKQAFTEVSPISKAAWQFGRMNTPRLVWDQPNVTESGFEQVAKALTNSSFAKNIKETFQGPNRVMRSKGYGLNLAPGRSWVRVLKANKIKLGGGSRVKKIVMNDAWATMNSNAVPAAEYGQQYEYTLKDPLTGTVISSGVASYEPMIGGDENPFRKPVYMGDKEEKLLAPDDKHYMEEPFGESFFPSAQVGYSRVKVMNLQHENVKRNATGYTVHEFYTAKDFPTLTERTTISIRPSNTKLDLRNLFRIGMKDYVTVSQGYSIILNDMHGKPKSQKVYAEDQESPISGLEYKYQAKDGKLNNEIIAIDKRGAISRQVAGVDFDIVSDMREQGSSSIGVGANGNLASFIALVFPAFVPTILPSFSTEHTMFRSTVMTKVINTYGILEETMSFDQGSRVYTKNMAYDAETGEVLVSRTTNIFGDHLYSLNYPAHWAYEGMGQSYLNIGVTVELTNGAYTGPGKITDYLFPGDEVYTGSTKGWISSISGNQVSVINKAGNKIDTDGTIRMKVIRSGHRNQQTVMVGQVTMVKNPLDINNDKVLENGLDLNSNYMVINAKAVEFAEDNWRSDCNCLQASTNPYVNGLKGIWRMQKEYTYLTSRKQARVNGNTDLRNDGFFTEFSPFWNKPSVSSSWVKNTQKWTWVSEVTEYSPYGKELENKDALNRYSAAIYGYNNMLPVAVISNSKHRESGYDGFEDYNLTIGFPDTAAMCDLDGFNFKRAVAALDSTESHTGKKSIRVLPSAYENNTIILKPLNICK